MRHVFLFCLILFINNNLLGQINPSELFDSISNNNIEFVLNKVGVSILTNNKEMILPTYEIEVVKPIIDFDYFHVHRNEIMNKLIVWLNDSDKDWSANLLLYHITKRDATLLIGVENKCQWVKGIRQADCIYWRRKYQ